MNPLERIDHWAAVAPTATAHISGDRKLTFGQLGAHANALAAYLLERFGEDRAPVAVLGHREPEMLIAFIGVAKSGRPYIPIDTALPQERINHILAIAKPTLVLTPHEIAKLSELGKSAPSRRAPARRPILHHFHQRQQRHTKGNYYHTQLPGTFHRMDAPGTGIH